MNEYASNESAHKKEEARLDSSSFSSCLLILDSKVKLPKLPKPRPRFLTAQEVKTFLKTASTDRLYALFVVAVHSGMRPSELLGLRWADVNLDTGLVSIQRGLTWNRKGGGYEISGLKTDASQRCIELPASVLQRQADERNSVTHAARGITDLQGKITFTPIPSGSYFILGWSTTRKESEVIIWNYRVNVKPGTQQISLSSSDAATLAHTFSPLTR